MSDESTDALPAEFSGAQWARACKTPDASGGFSANAPQNDALSRALSPFGKKVECCHLRLPCEVYDVIVARCKALGIPVAQFIETVVTTHVIGVKEVNRLHEEFILAVTGSGSNAG